MDYRERMAFEYHELKTRYEKLRKMLAKAESGKLDFEPSCPIDLLYEQLNIMDDYMFVLERRAAIENIDL